VSALIALFVTLPAAFHVKLFPPALEGRPPATATATTHVLVDTPKTMLLDLRQSTYDLDGITHRAALLGNVMGSFPVRHFIAQRAGLPPDVIRVNATATPEAALRDPVSHDRSAAGARIGPTDAYWILISSNPTVPMLDVRAHAPTVGASERLADATVEGLRDYLSDVARTQATPGGEEVHLRQLGRARGELMPGGPHPTSVLIWLAIVLLVSCAAIVFLSRLVRAWNTARREGAETTAPDVNGTAVWRPDVR
jgi:hypothetical protein